MMLNVSDYPIIWGVVFITGAVALIGFSRLIANTTATMSTVEQGFSKMLRAFLLVWVIVVIAYALLVGLDFTSFIPTLAIPLLIGTIVLFRPVPTSILRRVPLYLLILLGTYRIAGGIFVYAHFKHDLLSYGFAFNAGCNLDFYRHRRPHCGADISESLWRATVGRVSTQPNTFVSWSAVWDSIAHHYAPSRLVTVTCLTCYFACCLSSFV